MELARKNDPHTPTSLAWKITRDVMLHHTFGSMHGNQHIVHAKWTELEFEMREAVAKGIELERERCAKVAFDYGGQEAGAIAEAILEG